jgi:hypothetical protein
METRMHGRKKALLGAIVALASVSGLWLWWPNEDKRPPLDILSAPDSAASMRIVVGKRVQVSLCKADINHLESIIAADSSNAAHLIVAAMIHPPDCKVTKVVGYYSHDRGATWHSSFEHRGKAEEEFLDPTLAFGPDGSIYFASEAVLDSPKHSLGDTNGRIEFFRSRDGGRTWQQRTSIPQFLDRPWIAVDTSTGLYRNRIYCFANIYQPILFVSADQGESFLPPRRWPVDLKKTYSTFKPGNPVVLRDGTIVLHYDLRARDPNQRPLIPVLISEDGGQSFSEATPVNTAWRHGRVKTSNFNLLPQMAADARGQDYRDRLYCVWEDGSGFSQLRIFLSSSSDKGKTWSTPLVLSEQPAGAPAEGDYATIMPSVVVNSKGAVAVTWYDRRGLRKTNENDDKDPGYNLRFRVSLDGGVTWAPSMQVNEKTINLRNNHLGHTAGLAADAEAFFTRSGSATTPGGDKCGPRR